MNINMSTPYPVMSMTIQDVLPWNKTGMNKKVDIDAVLPFLILPLLLLLASLSFIMTCVVMLFIVMGALYVQSRPRKKNRSPFFFSWTISSGLYMFLVFEALLLKLFEVTQLEHFVFLLLLACTSYFFYKMKMVADFELALGSSKGKEYSPVLTSESYYCQICQIEVNERFFHSIWWDSCILKPNYGYYLAGQLFSFVTLLHGTNLGLTTVCQPFIFYANILLPQDCSDVYFDFQLAIIFVTCVYGLGYLLAITFILICQLIIYIPKYLNTSMPLMRDNRTSSSSSSSSSNT